MYEIRRAPTSSPANISSVEDEVRHETAAAVLHEDTDMRDAAVISWLGHIENKVLQRACLRDLPVNTGWHERLVIVVGARRHLSQVKDKITNLAEELVLIDIPIFTVTTWNIGVRIKQRNTLPEKLVSAF